MKIHLLFPVLIFSTILLSCNSGGNNPEAKSDVDIIDYGFDSTHPNAKQFNSMLNGYEEEIISVAVEWSDWKNTDSLLERFAFRTVETDLSLLLIFCNYQKDCISICESNFEPTSDSLLWGVNGGVAFVVSGDNIYDINNLAGYLAGEE